MSKSLLVACTYISAPLALRFAPKHIPLAEPATYSIIAAGIFVWPYFSVFFNLLALPLALRRNLFARITFSNLLCHEIQVRNRWTRFRNPGYCTQGSHYGWSVAIALKALVPVEPEQRFLRSLRLFSCDSGGFFIISVINLWAKFSRLAPFCLRNHVIRVSQHRVGTSLSRILWIVFTALAFATYVRILVWVMAIISHRFVVIEHFIEV